MLMLSQSLFLLEKDAYIFLTIVLFRVAGVGDGFYHLDTLQQFSYRSSYSFMPKVLQIFLFFFFQHLQNQHEKQRYSMLKLSLPVQCCNSCHVHGLR